MFSIEKMCRILNITRSSYYSHIDSKVSNTAKENQKILEAIKNIRNNKKKVSYGAPMMTKELNGIGLTCSKNRVARIMRSNGIQSQIRKRWKNTSKDRTSLIFAPNLLEGKGFVTKRPKELLTSDITYIKTNEGWLYLAIVLDVHLRKIIGWSMGNRITHELVLDAIKQAIGKGNIESKAIFHSDRGSQYSSITVREYLKTIGLKQSMSRKGNCYDNAITETFFKTLKVELVYRENFKTRTEAKLAIFDYIEVFYNRERRHSSLGYLSPVDFERLFSKLVA